MVGSANRNMVIVQLLYRADNWKSVCTHSVVAKLRVCDLVASVWLFTRVHSVDTYSCSHSTGEETESFRDFLLLSSTVAHVLENILYT